PLRAVPERFADRKCFVEVRGQTAAMQALRDGLRDTSFVRAHEAGEGEAPLAVVEEVNGRLAIRRSGRDLVEPTDLSKGDPVKETVLRLHKLARAQVMKTLPNGEGSSALRPNYKYEVEWGTVRSGKRAPPLAENCPLRIGDCLYVAVRNLSALAN